MARYSTQNQDQRLYIPGININITCVRVHTTTVCTFSVVIRHDQCVADVSLLAWVFFWPQPQPVSPLYWYWRGESVYITL